MTERASLSIRREDPPTGVYKLTRGVAKGGPGGPETPNRIPLKISKDKTCTH